jgi:hypothetical protein
MRGKTKLVPHHSHWGAFFAEVEDGRFVGVRPFGRDPDPSPLIEAMPAAVYARTRVAQPMVREGWLLRRGGGGRGREPFVPVSWERALDLVAAELDRVRRDRGAEAIMGGSQGWGSAGLFHDARTQVRRFLAASGGFIDQAANYSFGTALAFLPHVLGSAQAVTGPLTSWSSIAGHTRLLVLFGGANPKNMQVAKGGCGEHAVGGWMQALAQAGVEVVNISPIRDDGPELVNAEWIPIRPNTDTAMMLALVHALIAKRRQDEAFLARYCVGFDEVRRYVMGQTDGRPKDAEWASLITGVDADIIRALARRMAQNRTMLSAWPSGRRLRVWLWLRGRDCRASLGICAAGDGSHREPAQPCDPGGAHRRLPAQSGSELRLQRQAGRLSRHPPRLLGGRQSVPSSSGSQSAAPRLAASADHRRARALVDGDRPPRRYCPARDHDARTQRYRGRAPRPLRDRHAAGDCAGRRSPQRLRDIR